jgi:hypothetical protein
MRLITGELLFSMVAGAQQVAPVWWAKYQYLVQNAAGTSAGKTTSQVVGSNVDVSNEWAAERDIHHAQSVQPAALAAGSNEVFGDPMCGNFSSDGGTTWDVDLPLPPPKGNGNRFGSDPSLAFDSLGNLFYGYIVVSSETDQGSTRQNWR